MNRITVVGTVGSDPKETELSESRKMIHFSLVSTKYSKKQKLSMWYQCQIFSEMPFVTNFVRKGSLVMVSGTLELPKIYYSKTNNEPNIGMYIYVYKVDFLPYNSTEKKEQIQNSEKIKAAYEEQAYLNSYQDKNDEVPF